MNKKLKREALKKLKLQMYRDFSFDSAQDRLTDSGLSVDDAATILGEFGDWLQRRIDKLEGK